MRLAITAAFLVSCLVGCGEDRSITLPSVPPPTVYSATLSASPVCAGKLPPGEAIRTYTVSQTPDGTLHWEAPTITQSPADQRSSLKVDGNTVSLVIGSGWPDPQDDVFYGIWESLGGAGTLTIYGQGSGRVDGAAMSGTFEGDFDSSINSSFASCHAADHHFTLTPR